MATGDLGDKVQLAFTEAFGERRVEIRGLYEAFERGYNFTPEPYALLADTATGLYYLIARRHSDFALFIGQAESMDRKPLTGVRISRDPDTQGDDVFWFERDGKTVALQVPTQRSKRNGRMTADVYEQAVELRQLFNRSDFERLRAFAYSLPRNMDEVRAK